VVDRAQDEHAAVNNVSKKYQSSTVDRGFISQFGQTKDYKIGICYFSAKHAALIIRSIKSKDWFVRNQNNVSEWSDRSNHKLVLVSWSSTVQNGLHHYISLRSKGRHNKYRQRSMSCLQPENHLGIFFRK
jgi:hypothetical protein